MFKTVFVIAIIIVISSCSVKKDEGRIPFAVDTDGDGIADQKEQELGRSPFIADIPELEVSFLQNYSITVHYIEEGEEKRI